MNDTTSEANVMCKKRKRLWFAWAAAMPLAACMTVVAGPDAALDAEQSRTPLDAGAASDIRRCSGPPFEQGSCAEHEICGSLPNVGYDYCLPGVPCPDGMVEIMALVCAYPCSDASECREHGERDCALSTFAELTGPAPGWCTP